MFWALAVILVAVAGFTVVVARRHRPTAYGLALDLEQLRGFVYVGAVALVLLAVSVVVLGLVDDRSGSAEAVAIVGLFVYGVYLSAAGVITYATARR